MDIRRAGPGDLEALVELRAELWPEGSRDEHRAEIRVALGGRSPAVLPSVILVAEHEETLVGFAEVGLRSHADGCDPARACGYLEGWYVSRAFAGRGLGRALVERGEEWARAQGCTEMASDTWIDNEPAQRAHEALGFQVVDRCVNYRKSLDSAGPPDPPAAPELYGDDLARVHHEHFGGTADAAAGELLRRLAAGGVSGGAVVDLACGTGILSRRVLDAGFEAVGVDLSTPMLRLARTHAPGAALTRESLWVFDVPRCVAVAAVGEAFNYATDAFTPDIRALAERFETIGRGLEPGGLLLFDLAVPGRSGPTGSREKAWEHGGVFLYLQETEDPATAQLTRTIQTFTPTGRLYRRSRETHRLVTYQEDEVVEALERAHFVVERLEGYGGEGAAVPGWMMFAATRR